MCLTLASKQFEDDRTLSACITQKESSFLLQRSLCEGMQTFMKTSQGRTSLSDVKASDMADRVKARVLFLLPYLPGGMQFFVQTFQDTDEEYGYEIFDRLDKGAHTYFCGIKSMMPGIQGLLMRMWDTAAAATYGMGKKDSPLHLVLRLRASMQITAAYMILASRKLGDDRTSLEPDIQKDNPLYVIHQCLVSMSKQLEDDRTMFGGQDYHLSCGGLSFDALPACRHAAIHADFGMRLEAEASGTFDSVQDNIQDKEGLREGMQISVKTLALVLRHRGGMHDFALVLRHRGGTQIYAKTLTDKTITPVGHQDKVEAYEDEIFARLDKDAHIYLCGLKDMMPGIQGMLERKWLHRGKV